VREISLYFERRRAWELKQYGQLSAQDVEALQSAKERFASEELERLYALWSSGDLNESALQRSLARKYSDIKISFRTYLVSRKSSQARKSNGDEGSRLHAPASRGTSPGTSPSQDSQRQEIQGHEE